jgi:hypothetical protein
MQVNDEEMDVPLYAPFQEDSRKSLAICDDTRAMESDYRICELEEIHLMLKYHPGAVATETRWRTYIGIQSQTRGQPDRKISKESHQKRSKGRNSCGAGDQVSADLCNASQISVIRQAQITGGADTRPAGVGYYGRVYRNLCNFVNVSILPQAWGGAWCDVQYRPWPPGMKTKHRLVKFSKFVALTHVVRPARISVWEGALRFFT